MAGQESMPGGVKGAYVWEVTVVTKNGLSGFTSRLPGISDSGFSVTGSTRTINNNPALQFSDAAGTLNSTLDLGKLRSFSLFTVCQESDTASEKIIASLENDSIAEMVLTNRRMAALDVYRYAGYNTPQDLFPRIYSYTRNRSSDTVPVSRRLQLGRPPGNQQIPASVFKGLIPEIILFNRVISPKERRQVESYLALKYGITLNQEFPSPYLNSRGEIIWDAELNKAYNRNIAGIGRDDISGLNQSVSESSLTPGLMKIGVSGELKNNSYMLWGDNGKPSRFEEGTGIRRLEREWKISAFNTSGGKVLLETDMLALSEIDPLDEGESFWLMKDRSGTGKYPFGQTDYIQSFPVSSTGGIIRFGPVAIDADTSGNDVFTILAAPSFFARSIIVRPSCLSAKSGIILAEICGGEAPFDIVLMGISDSRFNVSGRINKREHVFRGISQGAYILNVTDAGNKVYTEKIWVANSSSWETRIEEVYTVNEGETIVLNASEGMPALDFYYSWTTPSYSTVNNEVITIDQPGIYLLSVTDDNNCNITREFRVKETGNSVFTMTDLYPNPTDGWFTVRIMLEREMDVNVVITDAAGRLLKQSLLRNDRFYRYTDMIGRPGIYFITLFSGMDKVTLRLIIL